MVSNFFSVNTIFFTFLGYPMSYLEFFGTIFTGLCVLLAAKNNIATWWVGLIGIILYGFLFYQISLYSDLLEQLYYFVTSFWGWYLWSNLKDKNNSGTFLSLFWSSKEKEAELGVSKTSLKWNGVAIYIIFALSFGLGFFMSNIHVILPGAFPIEASLPYLDAFTTVMSFVATIYLVKRKIENWYLWIIVDAIGVWLYWEKGVGFLSLLYFAFLINAIYGYFKWKKEMV